MFDIASFDTRTASEAGLAMPILNPKTGLPFVDPDGKAVSVTLLGPNSAKSKDAKREAQLRRADFATRNVRMTEEEFDAERHAFLTAVTIGWSFDTRDGKPFPFSPDNCSALWSDKRWDWVALQAWAFAHEDGNYLPLSGG